ncbi:uncharacterized protein B4U79_00709 [Dinothrombium tinctorium]|uniref:Chitin-binding type-2 domain-containing protein n=1 Tax=Dinothrombium tinctorium TaxID=1965070 RepID=A0A443QXN7_9ACAR|nr:uncharacterized protein B4U79_00709 [Dinothrombium tinctorium]
MKPNWLLRHILCLVLVHFFVGKEATVANPTHPTLRLGQRGSRWQNLMNCVRNSLNSSAVFDDDVRCVANKMIPIYLSKDRKCENCSLYFHCTANYQAVYGCKNNTMVVQAATALTECKKVSGINKGDTSSLEAGANGRNGFDCSSLYLCKSACFFDPEKRTCSPSNCPAYRHRA